MSEPAIRFEKVTRRFGVKEAVSALDLELAPGTVLGLLGRNGAGKTTALRLTLGQLHADAGRIRVLGHDPTREGLALRERVSLLSEETHLYPWMTVREIVGFGAALHPRWDAAYATRLLRKLELDPAARVSTLSRGSKAKVALVLAVSPRPDLLLLDDPTSGLDPLVRREVLAGVLESVPAEGGAVVYASHLVHDVERVADRIAVLDAGRMRLEGSLEALKRRLRRVVAVFDDDAPRLPRLPGTLDQESDGRVLSFVAEGDRAELEAHARSLGARRITVEPLPLEEILVASLRGRNGAAEVEHA